MYPLKFLHFILLHPSKYKNIHIFLLPLLWWLVAYCIFFSPSCFLKLKIYPGDCLVRWILTHFFHIFNVTFIFIQVFHCVAYVIYSDHVFWYFRRFVWHLRSEVCPDTAVGLCGSLRRALGEALAMWSYALYRFSPEHLVVGMGHYWQHNPAVCIFVLLVIFILKPLYSIHISSFVLNLYTKTFV